MVIQLLLMVVHLLAQLRLGINALLLQKAVLVIARQYYVETVCGLRAVLNFVIWELRELKKMEMVKDAMISVKYKMDGTARVRMMEDLIVLSSVSCDYNLCDVM